LASAMIGSFSETVATETSISALWSRFSERRVRLSFLPSAPALLLHLVASGRNFPIDRLAPQDREGDARHLAG
jgi:hypothetical protein